MVDLVENVTVELDVVMELVVVDLVEIVVVELV